jgi:hypothetical protein
MVNQDAGTFVRRVSSSLISAKLKNRATLRRNHPMPMSAVPYVILLPDMDVSFRAC